MSFYLKATIVLFVIYVVGCLGINTILADLVIVPQDPIAVQRQFESFKAGRLDYVRFVDMQGHIVVIAHHQETGPIIAPQGVIDGADLVLCCYPGTVEVALAQVWGEHNTPTGIQVFAGIVFARAN